MYINRHNHYVDTGPRPDPDPTAWKDRLAFVAILAGAFGLGYWFACLI
jgi:hypothetical protein